MGGKNNNRLGELLTDAAFVTALCVGDLSRQGKPPEERKNSQTTGRAARRHYFSARRG